MKHIKFRLAIAAVPVLVAAAVMVFQCGPYIARFDVGFLEFMVNLKARALTLVEKAIEPYEPHREECEEMIKDLDRGFRNAVQKTANHLTIKQWEILSNPRGYLLGGFLEKWKQEGQLHAVFIGESKTIIAAAFDSLIRLENGKPR